MYRTFLLVLLFVSCARFQNSQDRKQAQRPLVSITLIDKNGLSETITEKERLEPFQKCDFMTPQPYQKVLRVYTRDPVGKIQSIVTNYHDNGEIRQYLEIVNGRAYGQYLEWHPTGQKRIVATVIEGKADLDQVSMDTWAFDGLNRVYREDGTIEAKFPYSKGILEGTVVRYSPSGSVLSKAPYVGGLKDGIEEKFSPSGKLLEIKRYSEGYLNGESMGYYENDAICSKEVWDDGLLQTGSYFAKDGSEICSITDGTGKRAFFENGFLNQTREFQQGEELGEVVHFDSLGRITHTYFLKNGKKDGLETRYFVAKGQKEKTPSISMDWHEGMLQGTVKTWYPTGAIESQREYMSNYKHGLSMAWYLDGSIMLIEEYEKDRLNRGEYRRRGENNPTSQVAHGKGVATLFDAHGALIRRIRYLEGLPQDE